MVVERERPGTSVGSDVILRGDVHPAGLSFVSGHAVLVVALATIITPYLRGAWKVVPGIAATLTGIARIYVGAHNPLDVIGGAALGLVIGGGLNYAFARPATRTSP
jgi:undecaprenyl-diphosphatase